MDIRVLRYFVAIVEAKSISKAAQVLYLSQPTLSRQIKELEEELGSKLFKRGGRQIILTRDGQYLYNRAIEILNLVAKTQANFNQTPSELSGELTLGLAETPSLEMIAQVVTELNQKHPQVTVSLKSGNADQVEEGLAQGLLDFGLVFGSFDQHRYDYLEIPNYDRWGALVPQGHPLTAKKAITLQDLLDYPLLVSDQSNIETNILAGLGDYRIVGNYNLLYNASQLVKAGLGITLCLQGIVDSSPTSGLVFLPLPDDGKTKLYLLWKKGSELSNLERAFFQEVEKRVKNLSSI